MGAGGGSRLCKRDHSNQICSSELKAWGSPVLTSQPTRRLQGVNFPPPGSPAGQLECMDSAKEARPTDTVSNLDLQKVETPAFNISKVTYQFQESWSTLGSR